jgi:uncharacterized protein YkwD
MIKTLICTLLCLTSAQAIIKRTPQELQALGKEMLKIHTQVRTNPKSLIPHLTTILNNRKEKNNAVGVATVQEAIDFMKVQKPLGALTWSEGLKNGCRDQAASAGPAGIVGHLGAKGEKFDEFIQKYGQFQGHEGQNIAYGRTDALGLISQFIIDDGVPDRGHRRNIFKPHFKVMGSFTGDHSKHGYMTCVDFADGFLEGSPALQKQWIAQKEAFKSKGAPNFKDHKNYPTGCVKSSSDKF